MGAWPAGAWAARASHSTLEAQSAQRPHCVATPRSICRHSRLCAPSATASRIWWSDTRRHTQTIIVGLSSDCCFALAHVAHLRLQVVLQANLGDQVDLRLQEIDVLLGVVEDALQDVARDVVAHRLAMRDAVLDR